MRILGKVTEDSVLVEMSRWEFNELTGISDVMRVRPDRNYNFRILPDVRAALKLLTLRSTLNETSKSIEALAAICRTELPLYKEIENALEESSAKTQTNNESSP